MATRNINKTRKNVKKLLNIILFALLPMTTVTLNTGCVTGQSVKVTAAQTILAVQTTVDNAMEGYATLVELGKVSLDTRVKVRDAYSDYKEAMLNARVGLSILDIQQGALSTDEVTQMVDILLGILISLEHS